MAYTLIITGVICLLLCVVVSVAVQRRNINRQRQAALFDAAMRARFARKG